MAITSKEYWLDRADATIKIVDRAEAKYLKTLKGSYQRASTKITKEIDLFVNQFPTYSKASSYMKNSTQIFIQREADKMATLVSRGNAEIKKDLVNISKKARLTRLEGLDATIRAELSSLGNIQNAGMDKVLGSTLDDKYIQERFTIDKGQGFGTSFNQLPKSKIESVLRKPWSGSNYSERLWGNTKKLADLAQQEITQGLIRGDSSQDIAKLVRDKMGSSYNASERLVRTEMTNIASEADMLAYNNAVLGRYEYVATLDNRTSDECQALDGLNFKLEEAQAGVNLPPLHPNCRSTTIAHFGADTKKGLERRAKDVEGNTIKVPADMKYTEYKKEILNN